MVRLERATPKAFIFGDFKVVDPRGVAIEISNRRGRTLLALLCLLGGERIAREALSRLLWPGRFPAQAKASLRQCLHDLNRQLGPIGAGMVVAGQTHVAIDPSSVRIDLIDLERALADSPADDAIEMLSTIGDAPLCDVEEQGDPLGDWLAIRRSRVESRLRAAVRGRVRALEAAGETLAAGRLIAAWRRRGATEGGRAGARIAVLPFVQVDDLDGKLFLAEGVVDDLSARLVDIPDIALIGRTSVRALAKPDADLPAIAQVLGATHLVEGSVHVVSGVVRIDLRLIDGGAGATIWSHQVEGRVEEIIAARRRIGDDAITGLCAALGVAAPPTTTRRMTVNREAYALYLQGRMLVQRSMTDGATAKAVELLEQSLALDPSFAECWTALAEAHVHTAVFTPCLERVEKSAEAARCADRALALDPKQGHARAMRGIHEWTLGNPAGALDLAFEAYRLEPSNADVAVRLGSFLLYIGRTREALPFIEAAVDLDPVYGRNYAMLCTAHFNLGNIDSALAAGRRMVDLGMPGMWLAVVEAAAGDHEKGVETYYRTRLLMNSVILPPAGTAPMSDEARDAYWMMAAKGICSGDEESRALYCQLLGGLHATMPDPYDPTIAFPAIWMGHADLVMKIYRERIHPANMFGLMNLWADVEPIRRTRQHPDFMAFAKDIGLVEAWERHGWPDLLPADRR